MNKETQSFDIGSALPIVGGVVQGIQNEANRKQQREDQEDLMDIQYQNQRKLNQHGKELAYQQWIDTNYGAQVNQLEKAGLNAGLLYGMSGGGSTTASAGSGGSASSGSVAPRQSMDVAQIAQLALMEAQKENIEADTENKKASATNTDTKTAGEKTQNEINAMSKEDQIEYYKALAIKTVAEGELKATESGIAKTVQEDTIKRLQDEAKLPKAQAEEINARIVNMAKLADQGQQRIEIEKFAKELQAEYPGVTSVMGKGVNEITMWLQKQLAKVIGEENASNYRKVK